MNIGGVFVMFCGCMIVIGIDRLFCLIVWFDMLMLDRLIFMLFCVLISIWCVFVGFSVLRFGFFWLFSVVRNVFVFVLGWMVLVFVVNVVGVVDSVVVMVVVSSSGLMIFMV